MGLLPSRCSRHQSPTSDLRRTSKQKLGHRKDQSIEPGRLAAKVRIAVPGRKAIDNDLRFRRLIDPSSQFPHNEYLHQLRHRIPTPQHHRQLPLLSPIGRTPPFRRKKQPGFEKNPLTHLFPISALSL